MNGEVEEMEKTRVITNGLVKMFPKKEEKSSNAEIR